MTPCSRRCCLPAPRSQTSGAPAAPSPIGRGPRGSARFAREGTERLTVSKGLPLKDEQRTMSCITQGGLRGFWGAMFQHGQDCPNIFGCEPIKRIL
eukprot:7662333-Pyramimonas_sp.AAC.1